MHYNKCKFLYLICSIPAIIKLKIIGVDFIGISYFAGFPYVTRKRHSKITIGRKCRFMSVSWGNLIGLNHRCILSTTEEKAVLKIGNHCSFSGISIRCFNKIELGNGVRCGANVLIIDGDGHQDDPRSGKNAPVRIEDNVWVGANVTILKGVTIGRNSLIGAGSIVTNNIPPNVVAAGNPCRVIKYLKHEIITKLEKK